MSKVRQHSSVDRLAATLFLDEPAHRVKQVSPARASALGALGIRSVRDILMHYPHRYIDLSRKETVASAPLGASCTVEGVIHELQLKKTSKRIPLVEISLVDATGLLMVTMFRQPWLMDSLKAGMRLAVAGKVEFRYGYKRMTNPFLEVLEGDAQAEGSIIPVHPASEKASPAMMRRYVRNALDQSVGLYDPLPFDLRVRYRLMSRANAFECIHFPHSMEEAAAARRRLAYEEILLLELKLMQETWAQAQGKTPHEHQVDGPRLAALAAALPFTLSDEQEAAKQRILEGMHRKGQLNHLLLGDVGTGKTVVAAFALAAAADSGSQAALLAPTEVLVNQHAQSLGALFDQAGIRWAVLTGSSTAAERASIQERLDAGNLDVLMGTHALLEDAVRFKDLSVAVIDEQQRFGVRQRAALLEKGECVDALYLTATPIPRTLALALYGNLTLSYLTKRPSNAAKRSTFVHRKDDVRFAYDAARQALGRGEQVFVVCPLIGQDAQARDKKAGKTFDFDSSGNEESFAYAAVSIEDEHDFTGENLSAAVKQAEYLQATVFSEWKLELLHGRLSSQEKQAVMERFVSGETQVLVSTTVIEVGIDVPRATVMIIEDADRFGLSQLHQLRGRVGRGTLDAQVHLISASQKDAALVRLGAMESTDDGFELASYDLSLRQEGDILGNRQHGAKILKLVNVMRDGKMIEAAHDDARAIIDADPELKEPEHRALACEMAHLFAHLDEEEKTR